VSLRIRSPLPCFCIVVPISIASSNDILGKTDFFLPFGVLRLALPFFRLFGVFEELASFDVGDAAGTACLLSPAVKRLSTVSGIRDVSVGWPFWPLWFSICNMSCRVIPHLSTVYAQRGAHLCTNVRHHLTNGNFRGIFARANGVTSLSLYSRRSKQVYDSSIAVSIGRVAEDYAAFSFAEHQIYAAQVPLCNSLRDIVHN
jgi:hypothetical protein